MKYLKILPVIIAATFVSQDAVSIGGAAIERVNKAAAGKQAAEQLLGQRNAALTALGLPTTEEYRAALIAQGDHNGGATAAAVLLQVKGILNNPNNIAAANAILAIPGAQPDDVTPRNIVIAGLLQTAIINLPVDKANMEALDALQKNAPLIAVNANNIAAAIKLRNPDGGAKVGISADSVAAADALLRAVGGPLDVNAVTIGTANALTVMGSPVTADAVEAYGLLRGIGLGGGGITAQKVTDVAGRANLIDKKAAALLSKINKFNKAAHSPRAAKAGATYMQAAQAFAANDAAWRKATKADLKNWMRAPVPGRAAIVTGVAAR